MCSGQRLNLSGVENGDGQIAFLDHQGNSVQSKETVMGNTNDIADKVVAGGLKCLYHNHDFEFKPDTGGKVDIEYIIENSDPEKLNFQMDLCWVTKAGADPIAYFDKAPGRFFAWHVKDMDDQGRFAPSAKGASNLSVSWRRKKSLVWSSTAWSRTGTTTTRHWKVWQSAMKG